GPLAGLAFAAKDSYNVAGYATGLGNPSWARDHPPAKTTAPARKSPRCLQALLDAGANLAGKAAMSELAYDFSGQNYHYGTPPNTAAPCHMPGGSSSGCAALVASGEVAFALGGDTAGSVRVPASFCGVFSCRPSHGRVSLEGSVPLAPSFDTAGWFARDAELLSAVGKTLLAGSAPGPAVDSWNLVTATTPARVACLLAGACGESELCLFPHLLAAATYQCCWPLPLPLALQSKEVNEVLGPWVSGPTKPAVSAGIAQRLKAASLVSKQAAAAARQQADAITTRLDSLLGTSSVLLLPTTPFPAPPLGSDLEAQPDNVGRLMALTSIASLAGLPQVSMPLATLEDGLPVGVSIIGPRGSDEALLALAERLAAA
ncbi:hypothetical protein CHLNCDRAFT_9137, partial [Chlorella variabilis]